MKNSTTLIFLGSLALGCIAARIAGAIREKYKARKHEPAATFSELYEDNVASSPSIFDDFSALADSWNPYMCENDGFGIPTDLDSTLDQIDDWGL